MSRIECPHERETIDAVASGRWPERADAVLRDHIQSCVVCSDVALAATLLSNDFSEAMDMVKVPSAGLVWWKAELRARREAVRVASRPIAWVSTVACVIAAITIGFILRELPVHMDLASISQFVLEQPLVIWIVLGAIMALTPIALYFVYSDE